MENTNLDHWEKRFVEWYEIQGQLTDGSHDLGHFQRVWRTADQINREEGQTADPLVLLAAAYFHDLVSLPKNHPERKEASKLSAERAVELIAAEWKDFPGEKLPGVRHAIHAHSFSAKVPAESPEAKILQDADRMEAVGAIGLARVFYTAGQLGQQMFNANDPMAEKRMPDDQRYALDHFQLKLLRLPALMNTATGRRMAEEGAAYLNGFLQRIMSEIAR